MKQTKAPELTPSPSRTNKTSTVADSKDASQVFISMAVDMSWKLAIAVLVPVILGAELDKRHKDSHWFLIGGLVIAIILATLVIKRSYKEANDLTVDKKVKKRAK